MLSFLRKVFCAMLFFLLFACQKVRYYESEYLSEIEDNFREKINKNIPDFGSPTIPDSECVVLDMPEKVVWLTSELKDLSDPNVITGGTLRKAIYQYPTTFRYMGPNTNNYTQPFVWTTLPLLAINPETLEVMPSAATHWAFSKDGKTVYFKLHEFATWSDGHPCTADDFVFAVEFMSSPFLNDEGYSAFAEEIEIQKINDYCISIRYLVDTKIPPTKLLNMVNIAPRPKHFYGGEISEDWYIRYDQIPEPTTGAYEINMNESIQDRLLVYDRVTNWWARSYPHLKNTANVSRIEYVVFDSQEDILRAFYNGDLDVYTYPTKHSWEFAESQAEIINGYINRYIFNFVPLEGITGIYLNTRTEIFSNKRVRQALYYALDIQGMVDIALDGEYVRYHNVGLGQGWSRVFFNDETIRKPDFNPERAREIFISEGYKFEGPDGILRKSTGERLSFTLYYYVKIMSRELLYLRDKAREAGLEIILSYASYEKFWEDVSQGEYSACLERFSTWFFPNYEQHFSKASSEVVGSVNYWGYWSPQMEELLKDVNNATSLDEFAEANKNIERLLHDEALIIPTYFSNATLFGAWRWVRFPHWGNRQDIEGELDPYGYMWIDENIRYEVFKAVKQNKRFRQNTYNLSERYLKK
ncbi:MAG: ABC transporter substrate-binding protein [Treponemataceae bacterium]